MKQQESQNHSLNESGIIHDSMVNWDCQQLMTSKIKP